MTLLTGQIVGVSSASVWLLAATTVVILAAVAILAADALRFGRPGHGPGSRRTHRFISVAFAVLVGLAAAQSVQIVGSLLVMALLITPVRRPLLPRPCARSWATIFAEVSAVGGFVLSLAPGLPVSVLLPPFLLSFTWCAASLAGSAIKGGA